MTNCLPKKIREIKVAYSDPADEGIDNHSVPFAVISKGLIYINDVIFTQENLTITRPIIAERVKQYDLDEMFIESNNHGAMFIRDLREEVECPIMAVRNQTNKTGRILAQEGYVRKYFRFKRSPLPESDYDKFMQQTWKFLRDGTYKKDDAPDSLAGLCFMIRRNYGDIFE